MTKTFETQKINSSYRDPCGFVYKLGEDLYRQINFYGRENYDQLINSGLYDHLVKAGLLIPHRETETQPHIPQIAYKIIKPDPLPFISYPYEWSFNQLKDAALLTLNAQKVALQYGLSLQDASAYNVQFYNGRPILIDTLSFEPYREGRPWIAYRQFCQHFLAPLILSVYLNTHHGEWLQHYLDGIPIPICSNFLPLKTYFNPTVLIHIHLHAWTIRKTSNMPAVDVTQIRERQVSQTGLLGILDSLYSGIRKLRWQPKVSDWIDYDNMQSYSSISLESKTNLVGSYLEEIKPKIVYDIGANTGHFSRLASIRDAYVISCDSDAATVDQNYRQCCQDHQTKILPLVLDITNPSPALGWDNKENLAFMDRGPCDLILALALVHHLVIGKNIPMDLIAQTFSRLGKWLIIEFVPKEDIQVVRMLSSRQDIFTNYWQSDFEKAFGNYYSIIRKNNIEDSSRILYLMKSSRSENT